MEEERPFRRMRSRAQIGDAKGQEGGTLLYNTLPLPCNAYRAGSTLNDATQGIRGAADNTVCTIYTYLSRE